MSAHIRSMLFDYLSGDIPPEEIPSLEDHLAHCAACREDLRMLREAVNVLPRKGISPSDGRDEKFWSTFASGVEERIRTSRDRRPSFAEEAGDLISSFVHFNRLPLLAGSGVLAAIAVAVLLMRPAPAPPETAPVARGVPLESAAEPTAVKLHDYLHKSKVLLIGVTNLRTGDGGPIDLSVERNQSRALVHQARDLRTQPLDARSAKLVGDLEKILIQLANTDERHDLPDVEIIRSGIRHNNLLFKIRMTESVLDAGTYERNTP